MDNENKYGDIINLPHQTSAKHPRMSMIDRAAQFSPFAALTGHGAAIAETARLTDKRIELDENEKTIINEKLCMVMNYSGELPEIAVTYFQPDSQKSGGSYITVTGTLKKIDSFKHEIKMADGTVIAADNVCDVQSDIFGDFLFGI